MKGIGYGKDFFSILEEEDLIKEHLTRLIMTNFGERVNNYYYGTSIKDYLFNFSKVVAQDVEINFLKIVEEGIPEITVSDFKVELVGDDEKLIQISFTIKKKETLEEFTYKQNFEVEL